VQTARIPHPDERQLDRSALHKTVNFDRALLMLIASSCELFDGSTVRSALMIIVFIDILQRNVIAQDVSDNYITVPGFDSNIGTKLAESAKYVSCRIR